MKTNSTRKPANDFSDGRRAAAPPNEDDAGFASPRLAGSARSSVSNSRRSFLRRLTLGAVAVGPGLGLLTATSRARADQGLSRGDTAILQFLSAAELIEADLCGSSQWPSSAE